MKLAVLTAAAALSFAGLSTAHAGPRGSGGFGGFGAYGFHGGGGFGSYAEGSGYVPSAGYHHGHVHCAPVVYKTHTVEVSRHTQCRTAFDHCGRPYACHVTVVTYCDYYSNGSTRVWSRTFS